MNTSRFRSSESAPASAITQLTQPATLVPWVLLVAGFAVFYLLYFSPALLRQVLMAPGDGEIYYLPFFGLPATEIWNNLILSGYSVVSDIQAQTFYPLRWLSPTFNALVVSAYVVSAVGMFALCLKLTRSRLGALAAALVVSGSGFMVGHLGHLSMIHAAAWVPAILWALACLRTTPRWWPVAAGAAAVALSLLGGHPQVSIIGLLLAGCYGVHEIGAATLLGGKQRGRQMLVRVFSLFALGLMLALPSLAPLAESASASVRGSWTLHDFNTYSHSPETLRMLAFPNLYGANGAGPYGAYSGPWNMTELALYAGILPWFLMLAALLGWRRGRSHLFWVGVVIVSLVLTLGAATPLGRLVYELPVLGQFRAQARFGVVLIIALGVLTAFGVSTLLRAPLTRSRSWMLIAGASLMVAGTIASVSLGVPVGVEGRWWALPSGWVPLVLMLASLAALYLLVRKPGFGSASVVLLLLVIDLASFGWFYEWRYGTTPVERVPLSVEAEAMVAELSTGNGRVLPFGAAQMPSHPLRPNLNIRRGIPSVVGYGPLLSTRYATYTGADTVGGFPVLAPTAPLMDVLAVRWLAGSSDSTEPQLLGSGCGASGNLRRIRARLPDGFHPQTIRMVSHMGCSQSIPSGQAVGEVRFLDSDGGLLATSTVDAGEETAEWAYDRADVLPSIAHARPAVAESFDGGGFKGLWFDAKWPVVLDASAPQARFVDIALRDTMTALLRVKSLEISDASTGQFTQLAIAPEHSDVSKALGPERVLPGLPGVRERLGYRGMAWGVCRARAIDPADLPGVLSTGLDRSGARFDPFAEALVEVGFTAPRLDCIRPPNVEVMERHPGAWRMRATSSGVGLLVVSESYNAGWSARVDGVETPLLPVDGLVLGVELPAGQHEVELRYRPAHFGLHLMLSALAFLTALALLFPALRRPGWPQGKFTSNRRTVP